MSIYIVIYGFRATRILSAELNQHKYGRFLP